MESRDMMNENGYGFWTLAVFNIGLFAFFAISYMRPRSKLDWRGFQSFMAFIIALFTEMYGFPLTIYALSGWLTKQYPEVDLLAHGSGHLWETLLGYQGPYYLSPGFYISHIFIWGGVILLARTWKVLHQAQKEKRIAKEGLYAHLRHPQYLIFILIMFGFLINWPTIPTLVMFPVLCLTYLSLAKREEKDSIKAFGEEYLTYRAEVPAFIPRLRKFKAVVQNVPQLPKLQSSCESDS